MVATKRAPRIKNYTSEASEAKIFEAIRAALASHGAKRVMFDYDDNGHAVGLQFSIVLRGQTFTFALPARIGNVKDLVEQSYRNAGRRLSGDALVDQAYRTAWANIRDWTLAQMALIESGMVKAEEVFLPYLVNSEGRTYFEVFEEQLSLPAPRGVSVVEES